MDQGYEMTQVMSLKELTKLRSAASDIAFRSNSGEEAFYRNDHRATLEVVEKRIAAALAERFKCPPCPFCRGAVSTTPTSGRLECVDCGALMLRGRR